MSRLPTTDHPPTPGVNGDHAPCESGNGKPADAVPQDGKSHAMTPSSNVDRAEELTDKIAVNVAMFAAAVGRKIVNIAAHVGEAVSDAWAEAQSIRHGKGK